MKTYPYICYFGKSEVIVNEQPEPDKLNYDFSNKNHVIDGKGYWERAYDDDLKRWQSSCKTIPIAEGHDRQFKDYCFIKHTMSVYDIQANPVQIPSELVRFDIKCFKPLCVCDSAHVDCQGEEIAFFVEKEQETNEAIEFADFLLADYEMSSFADGREDDLCWELAGTEQKYTTAELYKIFLTRKHPTK